MTDPGSRQLHQRGETLVAAALTQSNMPPQGPAAVEEGRCLLPRLYGPGSGVRPLDETFNPPVTELKLHKQSAE